MWRRVKLLLAAAGVAILFLLILVIPVGGSFIITNNRFRFPEPGLSMVDSAGLSLTPVRFSAGDGVRLEGAWDPGEPDRGVIVFVHGLNRSRMELMERGAESRRKGYGVLLIDLRNHGESQQAYTTLGVHESRDVCAAMEFVRENAATRPLVLWGVSMGASTALLAARRCPPASAVIADSSFLSFEETIAHHFRLLFGLPPFPSANLMILLTRLRGGFRLEDGDVEAAVGAVPDMPVLFIAGGADRRMPPELARRLYRASRHPDSDLLIVPGATHGRAFATDRDLYLRRVFGFLDRVLPEAGEAASETVYYGPFAIIR